ncbi:PssD/Cps14F family polysaccharide biosynthesis glycosyltransferase [Vibrio cyclitrophicus]
MFIVVAGEGGHFTQAKRLMLSANFKSEFILVTDNQNLSLEGASLSCCISPLRDKYKKDVLYSVKSFATNLRSINALFKEHKITRVISTGPGISIIVALIAKVYEVNVVHIETWSRFKSKSFTGRIMYHLSDRFIVQHKCLLELYPRATYGGLL